MTTLPPSPSSHETVHSAEVLEDIRTPGICLRIWERSIPDPVTDRLRTWLATEDISIDAPLSLDEDVTGELTAHLQEAGWSNASVEDTWFLRDLVDLLHRFGALTDQSSARLRLEAVRDHGCCKFHTDNLSLRLLCTYTGPGTEWAPGEAVCRDQLGCLAADVETANRRIIPDPSAIRLAPTGSVLVFKGDLHPGEEGQGLVHRSAPVTGPGEHRLRLCIDPADSAW